MVVTESKLHQLGRVGLLLLIGGALLLDLMHGIQLGQHQVAYQPIYRLRQSLAVAISRLHQPPAGGYLAYKSVVNVLTENGFAILDGEPGPHLDFAGQTALLDDGPRLDRIVGAATTVTIDRSLPPELIEANELGLADYIYVGFQLFGGKISSLYYFFFLLTAATCLLYVLQFRDAPFLLFLLAVFLAEIFFLENYVRSHGIQLNTVSNSRLFSGLALVPAVHVLLVLWQRLPLRVFTLAGVVGQSLIFAFLLSCRLEAAWQAAMVIAVAFGIGLSLLRAPPQPQQQSRLRRFGVLWPAAIFLFVVSAYLAAVSARADARYAAELKNHIIWHEVLLGILNTSQQLRHEYVGETHASPDAVVYEAVIRDLNARQDESSPIVRKQPDGQLTIDLMGGWGEYDRLVKSLTLRIVYRHPLAVLKTFPVKLAYQVVLFDDFRAHAMARKNLQVPVGIAAVAALLCMAAGGFDAERRALRGALCPIAVVLVFALATPFIHPSPLAVGTLFAYLGAVAIVAACGAHILLRPLGRINARRLFARGGLRTPALRRLR